MLQKLFLFLICVGIIFANSGCRRRGPQNLNSVLHVALRQKVNSLDPARTSDYYASVLVSRAYEGLLQYKYLKRPYELEGALAEGLPEIQNDGRTYIFHIKKGVRFQNDAKSPSAVPASPPLTIEIASLPARFWARAVPGAKPY